MHTLHTRAFGSTSIRVSGIALGTVELGMDYGFKNSRYYCRPPEQQAVELLRCAPDLGINLFDTARAYGESERLIGQSLPLMSARPWIATKVAITPGADPAAIFQSVDQSRALLGVEFIDLLQVHNANSETLADSGAMAALDQLVDQGTVRLLGASVYSEVEALAVMERPRFRSLQVAFNLLDTVMARHVFPKAADRGVGVLVRSAFLRGVLTPALYDAPAALDSLKQSALAALQCAGEPVERMAVLALRYCLSTPGVSSVITGVRTIEELETNVAAAAEGPLDPALYEELQNLALPDCALVNPLNWREWI